ncbi:MAG: 16S rRNA processing protein RimM [Pseudomonadales bacterium]|nr:16S rRNA processing protein RimM [Pseudomonadales bacterium]
MADDPTADPIVVGRIGGAFGVLGWVRVTSFTDPPENLLDYGPWLIEDRGAWRAVSPAAAKPSGTGFVVQLRELASRDQAQALTGRFIAVPRAALPAIDSDTEYYWRDLIGLEVFDRDGRRVGRVDHLLATGAHDVLAIDTDAAELLVPFLARFVPEVDVAGGRLVIDWQEPV